jgi:2-phosphosulfolactate phosphatase
MADKVEKKTFEVCFSPVMFPFLKKENAIVVIVDILRATTAICTAFENGAIKIIPVAKVEDTYHYKASGFKIAGERDGIVIPGADFGNSPFNFTRENVHGQSIVITTTNGTQAIEMAKDCQQVIIGSFLNIDAIFNYLKAQNKPITVLCAGWKNKFNIEDSLFAGALATMFSSLPEYDLKCDSAIASMDLWNLAKDDLIGYIQKASHRERLRKLGLDDVIEYCFTLNSNCVIPALDHDILIDISKK